MKLNAEKNNKGKGNKTIPIIIRINPFLQLKMVIGTELLASGYHMLAQSAFSLAHKQFELCIRKVMQWYQYTMWKK